TSEHSSAAAPDELPLPRPGEIVGGRYQILRWIGGGGMGVVYEAVQEELGRRYAIKFLRRELASRPRALARLQREARLLGGMSHDHLTQVFDFGRYRERAAYIVMEYLEGQTLRAVLDQSGPLHLGLALTVMRQVAMGMAYAHAHGVVHRDLKPENLMLTSASDGSPRVKILDFGIAQQIGPLQTRLTPTGAELGTYHYMSPEQARALKTLTAASDVYSLGVICYELLSGKRPHPGESYAEVMFHLLTQPPVPLDAACPASLRALIDRCLRTDPGERYQSAEELLEALNAPGEHAPATSRQPAPPAGPLPQPGRGSWLRGAVLGAVAAASLVWLLGGGSQQAPRRAEAPAPSPHGSQPPAAKPSAAARPRPPTRPEDVPETPGRAAPSTAV